MSDNYICFNTDSTAPDLLPLDDFINDIPYFKNPEIVSLQQELANINAKIERLNIDSNTQSLRVEIGRVRDASCSPPSNRSVINYSTHAPK